MNQGVDRRSFLKKAALGLLGFAILPPANTYQRVWRAERKIFWNQTQCATRCVDYEYV